MQSSQNWIAHFKENLQQKRVDWSLIPRLTEKERQNILPSLKAWQLGETSDGVHLLAASARYAEKIDYPFYCRAVQLFIREEQKHGNNLGIYLDLIGEKRIQRDWGDSLFHKIRYFNTSMELWTLAVIAVESTAQIFYQCMKDASGCPLLKQICTDILIDEAYHIDFQQQRLQIIFQSKSINTRIFHYQFYRLFYFSTILVVWFGHRRLFKAGGVNLRRYWKKMQAKFDKTIARLMPAALHENAINMEM